MSNTGFPTLSVDSAKKMVTSSWFSKALTLGVAGAIGFGFYKILPALIAFTANVFIFGAELLVLALFLYYALNPRVWKLVDYMLYSSVRAMTGLVVSRDPIGIMRGYLAEVVENIHTLSECIGDLRGAVTQSRRDLEQAQQERETAAGIVTAAEEDGNGTSAAVVTQANIVKRRDITIAAVTKDIEDGVAIIEILSAYLEKGQAYQADLEDSITWTARERKRVKTQSNAFSTARKIMSGQTLGAELYDQAVDTVREQNAAMVGDMQQFVAESRGAIEAFKLQQKGAVAEVRARLKAKSQSSLLLEYKPGQVVESVSVPAPVAVPVKTTGAKMDDFLKI